MIKHITLWKLKDFALGNDKETNFEIVKKNNYEVTRKSPFVRRTEVGRGFTQGVHNYDICIILEFNTREDLNNFMASKIHEKAHKFNAEIRSERAVIDYVVEE
jgi:hypothetical protein